MKKKNLAFTLAEVLIVIGIIGVVAALTLPNLNHATGDKETVTRLQKAYSILSEANDRAVAIYGPISSWPEECRYYLASCWVKRVGEFLKVSKTCDESNEDSPEYSSCESLAKGDMSYEDRVIQLSDGISFGVSTYNSACESALSDFFYYDNNDVCIEELNIDIDGPTKGKNTYGSDIFVFRVLDQIGLVPYVNSDTLEGTISECLDSRYSCSYWVVEYGNVDYLKADSSGKCNDSNIILDGVTNTSCH